MIATRIVATAFAAAFAVSTVSAQQQTQRVAGSVIVTVNLSDFRSGVLATHGVEARHADSFIRGFLNDRPDNVLAAVRTQRAR